MITTETRIFCRIDGISPQIKEQKRLKTLTELGLLDVEIVPVFEEATQTVARFLEVPISFLSIMTEKNILLKSTFGLSRVGLMNDLATSRQLPREESFCTYVIDSGQVLAINDTFENPVLARSVLVQYYGIRSYLGAPLMTKNGICLGVLAVMDINVRNYSQKDMDFLAMTARWTLSEYENNLSGKNTSNKSGYVGQNKSVFNSSDEDLIPPVSHKIADDLKFFNHDLLLNKSASSQIKVKLLTQLSQELRTPLTSVMGMASVLNREVYGPLTGKQKEYLEIIYNSGQQLVSIVDEILGLGVLDEEVNNTLNLTSQDIEMLCQQVINSVEKTRLAKQQDIRLSGGTQNRIWVIDKEKVRQMIYYLLLSIMQTADISTTIHIRIYRKNRKLNMAFWISHPLLGEGLASEQIYSKLPLPVLSNVGESVINSNVNNYHFKGDLGKGEMTKLHNNSPENLGLLLSCQLAEMHQGQIVIESSSEINCRYVIILPQLDGKENE